MNGLKNLQTLTKELSCVIRVLEGEKKAVVEKKSWWKLTEFDKRYKPRDSEAMGYGGWGGGGEPEHVAGAALKASCFHGVLKTFHWNVCIGMDTYGDLTCKLWCLENI